MRRFLFPSLIALSITFILLFSLSVQAVQQTDTSATRTAIAITREPILGTPATPSNIDLTATVAYQELEDKVATLLHQPNDILVITESAIVAQTTQQIIDLTHTPIYSATPTPTVTALPCVLLFFKTGNGPANREILSELKDFEHQGPIMVYDLELAMPLNCTAETHFLHTSVEISLQVSDTSDNALIPIIEDLLAHLQNSQLTGDGRSLRLIVQFQVLENYCQLRRIDTGFTTAKLAYREGLRGEKLIEAIGGLIDTDKDLAGYCPLMDYWLH